jgi:hypothetical protein
MVFERYKTDRLDTSKRRCAPSYATNLRCSVSILVSSARRDGINSSFDVIFLFRNCGKFRLKYKRKQEFLLISVLS